MFTTLRYYGSFLFTEVNTTLIKKLIVNSLFILLMIGILSPLNGLDLTYTPTEMIVKTEEPVSIRGNSLGISEIDTFLADKEVKEIKAVTPSSQNRFFVVRFEEALDWESLRSQNLRFNGIEYIQPNYISQLQEVVPNDPLYHQQVLNLVRVPQAWQYETGNEHIVVAIVDSGLWFEHPEFWCNETDFPKENIWINHAEYPPNGEDSSGNGYIDDWRGWDFVDAPELAQIAIQDGDYLDQDNDPSDESGHGTHVAGIIGAAANNSEGIAGICWEVKLMILRAGFRTTIGPGYLQDDDAAAAIIYAVDNGAHIINLSWGSSTYSPIIADVCQYAYDRGVVVIASAGNVPGPEIMYPAKLNTTISVGAVNNSLNLTGFSSYGPELDLVAPGEFILSTYLEQSDGSLYHRSSGTSMSAPFVAGVTALLLAQEPGLSVDEVRSRLFSSATDLGTTGFDNTFGHGLLNAEALLTMTDHPFIEVTYPYDHSGIDSSFNIIGTVNAPQFFRYSVMFTDKELPTSLDWKDVTTHQNVPQFYFSQVDDDVIANFVVAPTLPDNEYLIRIRLEKLGAQIYEKRFIVNINKSVPNLKEGFPVARKRYRGDLPYYFITAEFDQRVTTRMTVFSETGDIFEVQSNYADSLHILQVPQGVPEGSISVQFSAWNISGLEYISDYFADVIFIEKTGLPTDTFVQNSIGPAVISVPKSYDFSGNGFYEFVGMSLAEGQALAEVKMYEFKNNLMEERYQFEESFLPIDMGRTSAHGMEILGLVGDTGRVFGTFGDEVYPTYSFWSSGNVVGGNMTDYTNDGLDNLILIRNYQNTRILSLYRRTGVNQFTEDKILFNQTESAELNTFSPRVIAKDLNNNGYMNVLASDTDGDVMVYELYSAIPDSLIWSKRLPVRNLYHISVGDYTGNGQTDFCVGGYETNFADPNKTFWHFEFFTYNDDFDDFVSIGYLSFDHFDQVNSINAIDLNGDGSLELVFALSPYLFIIDYVDGEFKPIWKGSSVKTYNVVPIPATDHHPAGIIVNNLVDDSMLSQFVTLNDFSGPPAPIGLTVQPVNEQSIRLEWNNCSAEYYQIFRRHNETITLIDSTTATSYLDISLTEGEEYHYALKSVDHSYYPDSISNFSVWQSAVPFPVPNLLSVRMTSANELRLLFDVQLSNDAINVGYYIVNNGIGSPNSVNHTENHRGLLLRFNNPLTEPQEEYLLEINGLTGRSGVPFPHGYHHFAYNDDLVLPVVLQHQIINRRILEITFSKEINPEVIEDEENFVLDLPKVDLKNEISTFACIDNQILLTFKEKLKVSNEPYFLIMNNIEDLAGNELPNNQTIIRFQIAGADDLSLVEVVPNPFNRNRHQAIEFIGFPLDTKGEINIFTLSGEIVYSADIAPMSIPNTSYYWQAVNNANRNLSSGVYFYVIRMADKIKRGQIAIVN